MNEKTISIVNNIDQIRDLAAAVEALSDEWNIPMETIMSLNLVFEELVTNIIFYGYDDKLKHNIVFNLKWDLNSIEADIIDDAKEFNPVTAENAKIDDDINKRKIGGLGIHLVKKLTDVFTYQRIGEKNITRIIIHTK
jgi:anti-sigma regulatory factor (Ser/Thr protein kinase)